jgi:Peptidase propeptide and YPEB domain
MTRHLGTALVATLLFSGAAIAAPTAPPRISKAAATQTALSAVPGGKVESVELETEHRQLIYSFDISVPGQSGVEEVWVSANTGKIVARKHEGSLKERLERVGEKLERH